MNNNFNFFNSSTNNNNFQTNNLNNLNFYKNDQTSRKRHRLSSFEGIFPNLEKDSWVSCHKKSIDENEIINNFCQNIKFDFIEDENLENIIFMSNSDSASKDTEYLNKKRSKSDNLYKTNSNVNFLFRSFN